MPNKSDNVEPTPARPSTEARGKFKSVASEDAIKSKGIKQKIVNRVKSWGNRDKCSAAGGNVDPPETDEPFDSNLTRARGSLENLRIGHEDSEAPSCSASMRRSSDSPKSSPIISTPTSSRTSSKSLFWDPFDKKGRKTKKEFKRNKKKNKNVEQVQNETACSTPSEGKSCLARRTATKELDDGISALEAEDVSRYKYKYVPKNSKSVVFTNEVFVVYFNGEEVLSESKEPLKKDTEQQLRNKEMRQGHFLKTEEKYNLCLY